MNEEEKKPSADRTERGLDDRKKTALLRYVAILFAVAFLCVLISMFQQMRDSRATIFQLNQSSASALEKTEQLQENYQALQAVNKDLEAQIADLEAQVAELSKRPEIDEDIVSAMDHLRKEAKNAKGKTQEAYDALLYALESTTLGSQEGNVAFGKAMDTLETLKDYLGEKGMEVYEGLLENAE